MSPFPAASPVGPERMAASRVRHIVLDALAPSDDENVRLRPDPPAEWKAGAQRLQVRFDPYAIHFWSLE